MNTDTPRTDACPHCGAGVEIPFNIYGYKCGHNPAHGTRSELCCEREARRNAEDSLMRTQIEMQLEIDKAEAEVERLREDNQKLRARLNYVQGCECDNYLHPYCNKLIK